MNYDLIIIGAGPSGLTAAIYAARYKLNVVVISKTRGGTAATASKICNYPSYDEIKGFELMENFIKQVEGLEVPIFYEEVLEIKKGSKGFKIKTDKKEYSAKMVIFAGGTIRSRLNAKGESKFIGKGVSYCATCDAAFYKEKKVAVVGGSDAALTSALLLSEYAKKVYVVYRRKSFFRSEPAWIDLVKKEKKIELVFNEEVVEIIGDENLEEIKLKSGKRLKIDGVFVEIGSIPNTDILKFDVKKDKKGYIIADKTQKTNVKDFYAVGDITNNPLKQIVTSAGEGAIAAFSIYTEIKKKKND
jgi:thioredoxin reductase (NADPH)